MIKSSKSDKDYGNDNDSKKEQNNQQKDRNIQQIAQFDQSFKKKIKFKNKSSDRIQNETHIIIDNQTPDEQQQFVSNDNVQDQFQNLVARIISDIKTNYMNEFIQIHQQGLHQDQIKNVQRIEEEIPLSNMMNMPQAELGTMERPITDLGQIFELEPRSLYYIQHADHKVLPLTVNFFNNERWVRGFMRNQNIFEAMFRGINNYHVSDDFSRDLLYRIKDVAISTYYDTPQRGNCWIIRQCEFNSSVNILNEIEKEFRYLLNGQQPSGQECNIKLDNDQAFYIKGRYDTMTQYQKSFYHEQNRHIQQKKGSLIHVKVGGQVKQTPMYVDYAFNNTTFELKTGELTAPINQLCTRCFWFNLKQ